VASAALRSVELATMRADSLSDALSRNAVGGAPTPPRDTAGHNGSRLTELRTWSWGVQSLPTGPDFSPAQGCALARSYRRMSSHDGSASMTTTLERPYGRGRCRERVCR
jgi:hypothetical protein